LIGGAEEKNVNLGQDSRLLRRGLKKGPAEYEAGVTTTRQGPSDHMRM